MSLISDHNRLTVLVLDAVRPTVHAVTSRPPSRASESSRPVSRASDSSRPASRGSSRAKISNVGGAPRITGFQVSRMKKSSSDSTIASMDAVPCLREKDAIMVELSEFDGVADMTVCDKATTILVNVDQGQQTLLHFEHSSETIRSLR